MRQQYGPVRYLEALLTAELEECERSAIARRIFEAKLRVKTLEEFDFSLASHISAARVHQLAEGGYIQKAEPLVFVGEPGTGKTHLANGLCVAACRQRRRAPAYHRDGSSERSGGSETRQSIESRAGPVVALRADCVR